MKLIDDSEKMKLEFNSVSDFKKYLRDNKNFEGEYDRARSIDYFQDGEYWRGTATNEEFEDILNNGSELKDTIKASVKHFRDDLEKKYNISNQYQYDVEGLFFDVGLVLQGVPETWLKVEEDEERKLFTFKINLVQFGSITSTEIMEYSTRILAMSKALESLGVSTRIEAHYISKHIFSSKRKLHHTTIVAKDFDSGINYKTASTILHTSFYRRGIFRIREISAGKDMKNYGSVYEDEEIINLDTENLNELEHNLFGSKE